ncbi:MAG: transcription-repair coupling factor [Candidatus Gracilibacteria bacterium]|nr:transcription-repair coupling factor [Candidatus Gracilibacteria bacterium]
MSVSANLTNLKPVCSELAQTLKKNQLVNLAGVSINSAKALIIAILAREFKTPLLWITDDQSNLNQIQSDLSSWQVKDFFILGEQLLTGGDKVQLAQALSLAHQNKPGILVSTMEILKEIETPHPNELEKNILKLKAGEKLEMVDFFNKLIDLGYKVSPGVLTEPGTYVKRGGIIDVFPVNFTNPVKIELEGDEIISINEFNFFTNEKLNEFGELSIYPIELEKIGSNFFKYFEQRVVVCDEIEAKLPLSSALYLNFLPFSNGDEKVPHLFAFNFNSILRFHNPKDFTDDLREKLLNNWQATIFTKDQDKVWNLLVDQGFSNEDLTKIRIIERNANTFEHSSDLATSQEHSKQCNAFPDAFQNPDLKLMVVTEKEIFGQFERKANYVRTAADSAFLANLNVGDLVVHIDHGIGRFMGIETKTVAGNTREYLYLQYAKGDKLFTPVEQADKVNKYIGATGDNAPQLTRLGSAEWNTVTTNARKESLEIAKELLELYALRETAKGFSHREENELQQQFETDFPYVETPGQLKSIVEIKKDMENDKPMDRLLCGDVGFGKTEVAMRAAFKAVQNGKQVAVLSPITILTDQHYHTFIKRFAGFPVEIAALSRFSTPSEQRKTIAKVKSGKVNIIIGTHRLLQPDVEFKDLGLLIIDEEQRFGVKQKETLKKLRHNVDILSLTATPIPRTLNMALSGLRDISTITTPPPGRLPVVTEVRRFSFNLIREVIMRELERQGQVYFLHNRVQTIESTTDKLRALVPEARFIVAHGQLPPSELESRIIAFKDHKFDVLVSSTIIENGIDLPNANTLVVDRAERLGLSQAYQLRGRVGRSKKQAYAYFMYHSQKLDDTSKKRLRAIVEASELGSGFQIAMRDLEIRGAGDILGAKQHGSINAIGVSHFTRLLKNAVAELKSGKKQSQILDEPDEETSIDLPVSAFLPDSYISDRIEKLKLYQRLASCKDLGTLKELEDEIVQNFGKLKEEGQNLIKILKLKIVASKAGIISIKELPQAEAAQIILFLSNKVTPPKIMNLLDYNSNWAIIGHNLKIDKPDLGESWFNELIRCVQKLHGEVREKKQISGLGTRNSENKEQKTENKEHTTEDQAQRTEDKEQKTASPAAPLVGADHNGCGGEEHKPKVITVDKDGY